MTLFQLFFMALVLLSQTGLEEDGGRLNTITTNSFTVPSFHSLLLFDLFTSHQALFSSHRQWLIAGAITLTSPTRFFL